MNATYRAKLRRGLLVTAGILAMIGILWLAWDFRHELMLMIDPTPRHRQRLMQLLRSHGMIDGGILIVVIGLLNAIPGLSNSLLCILAGLCYGPWIGLLINWLGNFLGSVILVELIRHVDVSAKLKANRLLHALTNRRHPRLGLTLGYMIPVVPSVLVDYAGVQMKLSRYQFAVMILVGTLPTSFLYAFGGDALFNVDFKRMGAVVIALLILIGLYLAVRRKLRDHSAHSAR